MACLKPEGNSTLCIMADVCPAMNGSATLVLRSGAGDCVYSNSTTKVYDYSYPMPDTGGGMTPEQYNGLVAAINASTTATGNASGFNMQGHFTTQTKVDELGGTGMAIALLLVFISFVVLGYRLGKRKGDM